MYNETEGIIFRQIKIVNGRRMILLFSKKYGKISAGTGLNEGNRSKAALAMRPFTLGKYDIYKKGDYYSINSGETLKSFYAFGENIDKYMAASYALEITDKMLQDGHPLPRLFTLLVDLLTLLDRRKKKFETPLIAYQIKAFKELGVLPELKRCAACGKEEEPVAFSIADGGILCQKCMDHKENSMNDSLIYRVDFGIVDILNYFLENPLECLEGIALDQETVTKLQGIIKAYGSYHLELGLIKSEACLSDV